MTYAIDSIEYFYDIRNRLTQKEGTWMDYELYYDGNQPSINGHTPQGDLNYNGNINGIKATYDLSSAYGYISGMLFDEPTVYNYSYDEMNRLVKADAVVGDLLVGTNPSHLSYKLGDVSFEYDLVGNMSHLERYTGVDGSKQDWAFDFTPQTNKLIAAKLPNGDAARNYTYDGSGNLVSDNSRKIAGITYSETNLPLKIQHTLSTDLGAINNTMYYYDYLGNRIFKQSEEFEASQSPFGSPPQGAYYLRDVEGKEIAVFNTGNSSGWSYYVFGNEREARVMPNYDQQPQQNTMGIAAGTHISWLEQYVSDHLGNTRVVYRTEWDATQSQVKYTLQGAYDYYPYGKILRKYVPGGGIERYLSTQHERDHETISNNTDGTGLDYRINRYYDSDIVRFNSVDKLADHPNQIDKSPYAYVWGNPVMLTDPDGNCPECRDWLISIQIRFNNWLNTPSAPPTAGKEKAPDQPSGVHIVTFNDLVRGNTSPLNPVGTNGAETINIDEIGIRSTSPKIGFVGQVTNVAGSSFDLGTLIGDGINAMFQMFSNKSVKSLKPHGDTAIMKGKTLMGFPITVPIVTDSSSEEGYRNIPEATEEQLEGKQIVTP